MSAHRKKRLSERLSLQQRSQKNKELSGLIAKASELAAFDKVFCECLPLVFRDQIHLNELQGGTLSLTCFSAAIATRFRMQQDSILNALRQKLYGTYIQRVEIKIRPALKKIGTTRKPMILSKENAQLLLDEAGQTKDINLKAVLTRLAMHANTTQ